MSAEWLWSLLAWGLLVGVVLAVIWYWRRYRLQMVTSLVAVVVTLGFVELALRSLHLPWGLPPLEHVSSVEYHHVYPPDTAFFQGPFGGRDVIVHTNADGLRTKYSPGQFHAFEHRVVVVGDSFAFGCGVPDGETLTERLEAHLRRSLGTEDVAVLNAGIISSSPLLQRALWDGVLVRYRPTAVVQLLDPTDFVDDMLYWSQAASRDGALRFDVVPSSPAPDLGRVARIVAPVWRALVHPFSAAFGSRPLHRDEPSRFLIFRSPREITGPLYEATLQNTAALAKDVKKSGASFLLVLNARYQLWAPAQCPRNWESEWDAYRYSPDDPFADDYLKFMEEARRRVPFGIHDLRADLRAAAAHEQLVFEDDPHWNARGSDVAADSVARAMLAREMVR